MCGAVVGTGRPDTACRSCGCSAPDRHRFVRNRSRPLAPPGPRWSCSGGTGPRVSSGWRLSSDFEPPSRWCEFPETVRFRPNRTRCFAVGGATRWSSPLTHVPASRKDTDVSDQNLSAEAALVGVAQDGASDGPGVSPLQPSIELHGASRRPSRRPDWKGAGEGLQGGARRTSPLSAVCRAAQVRRASDALQGGRGKAVRLWHQWYGLAHPPGSVVRGCRSDPEDVHQRVAKARGFRFAGLGMG